jgi:anhydro-N-acetylmuramic acid kinase
VSARPAKATARRPAKARRPGKPSTRSAARAPAARRARTGNARAALPPRIERLVRLAALPERRVLGLMSGTSLDGLDLALCAIRGQGRATALRVERFQTLPYSAAERERLRALVSQPSVPLAELTVLHAWLAARHAAMVRESLAAWGVAPEQVHLLASHGQTVYHAPEGWGEQGRPRHATLQLGDGDQLAVRTGLLTVSDFRQKEIAAGGQGAPLAPYADALLFGGRRPRILLNLGGIANFTWLPAADDPAAPLCGDTGPGNGLIDRAVRRGFPERADGFDRGGRIAARGRVHAGLLAELKRDTYYLRPCPKSTGPETFGDAYLEAIWQRAQALRLPAQDVVATLTRLTVETVAETLRRERPDLRRCELFVSGGGRENPLLVRWLREALPELAWRRIETLGVPPDAKEAVLFAVLAHESLFGEGFAALAPQIGTPDPGRRYGFGKLSWPD